MLDHLEPGLLARASVFVATLGWSRVSYVEFVTDERVETLIEVHENAFPREIVLRSTSGLALHLGSLALRRRGPDRNGAANGGSLGF